MRLVQKPSDERLVFLDWSWTCEYVRNFELTLIKCCVSYNILSTSNECLWMFMLNDTRLNGLRVYVSVENFDCSSGQQALIWLDDIFLIDYELHVHSHPYLLGRTTNIFEVSFAAESHRSLVPTRTIAYLFLEVRIRRLSHRWIDANMKSRRTSILKSEEMYLSLVVPSFKLGF